MSIIDVDISTAVEAVPSRLDPRGADEALAVGLGARLRVVAGELSSIVTALGAAYAGALLGSEAARAVSLFAEVERLAMAGKTLSAGRVAETGYYRAAGFDTAQRWLADRTKVSAWEAAKTIETARHLGDDELALTRDAFVSGSLTATQAQEIASASAKAPAEQERLLGFAARETTAQLKDECRKVRLARSRPEDPEDRRRRVVKEMAFGHRELGGGLGELFVRMPTSWLVLALAAIRTQCDEVFARAKAQGRSDPHQAYMVEALVTLLLFGNLEDVERATGDTDADVDGAHDCDAEDVDREAESRDAETAETDDVDEFDEIGAAGEAEERGFDPLDDVLYDELLAAIRGASPGPKPPRRGRRAAARKRGRCRCGGRVVPVVKIIARADVSALLRGHAVDGELCDIPGVGPVPVSTVRELWPDAVVKLVITCGVDVVNVTHLGRRATEAMETAMQFAMPRCSNIACDNDRFVQIDHRLGYSNVHRTRLDELDPLCSHCHALKTNENWQLVSGKGRRRFVPPEHPDRPRHPSTSVRRT